MKNDAQSFAIFREVFGGMLQQDGFRRKSRSTYCAVDFENSWLITMSMNLYDNGRLFRICLNVYPFTNEYLPTFQRENTESGCDLARLTTAPSEWWGGNETRPEKYFTLTPYMPTEESMLALRDIYTEHVRHLISSCKTFLDAVDCEAMLRVMDFGFDNNKDRMNAMIYAGEWRHALLWAYRYRNHLMDEITKIQKLTGDVASESLQRHYKESLLKLRQALEQQIKTIDALQGEDKQLLQENMSSRVQERRKEYALLLKRILD